MREAEDNRSSGREPVVDAHVHLWRYHPERYSWIDDRMRAIRRDFTEADLVPLMQDAAVDQAIVVQSSETLEETSHLLQHLSASPQVAGVVGWLPFLDLNGTADALALYSNHKKLLGARYIAQGQPAGFFDRAEFNASISLLRSTGLVYDILIYEQQVAEVVRFVDRHPEQHFVLDHFGKPRVAAGELEPWASHLRELALRPNIACKLSGLTTEAEWESWSREALHPYLDIAVEAFGAKRLLAGSDWPVCLLATSYGAWWELLREYFRFFSAPERDDIFGGNASRIYSRNSGGDL